MPTPRSKQVSLQATKYYHCVSRCVRRACLCGEDKLTKKNYDHRRQWIEKRLLFLASVFCIDVCAYAVMSNHCHVVLRINDLQAKNMSEMEVAQRWLKVCKGTLLTQEFVKNEHIAEHLHSTLKETLAVYRQRLMSLSWFMQMLNEPIARMANKEDECTGRFWEGRFSSHALLDEAALIACMVYVDLNPVRAGIADTPENSQHTSVNERLKAFQKHKQKQPRTLMPFTCKTNTQVDALPLELSEYLSLVDITGRCIREDKAGYIDNKLPPILTRLAISQQNWLSLTQKFETSFQGMVGSCKSMDRLIEADVIKRRRNLTMSRQLFA